MINKFKILCLTEHYKFLLTLFFGSIIAVFFELIGLGSIPVFAMVIVDFNLLKTKLPSFIDTNIINTLNQNELAIC